MQGLESLHWLAFTLVATLGHVAQGLTLREICRGVDENSPTNLATFCSALQPYLEKPGQGTETNNDTKPYFLLNDTSFKL